MNPKFVWPAVTLAGLAMVAATIMVVMKVDRETIVIVMSMLVVPVLGAMIAAQVSNLQSTTQQVQQQTNGTQTRLLEIIAEQSRQLAVSQPPRLEGGPVSPAAPLE